MWKLWRLKNALMIVHDSEGKKAMACGGKGLGLALGDVLETAVQLSLL